MSSAGMDVIERFLRSVGKDNIPKAIYRGHANSKWELIPSAFRERTAGIDDIFKLRRWKATAARYANPKPSNDLEWLVLAQHYGIATPLLDWTSNPLVALYFASQNADGKYDGSHAKRGSVLRANTDCFINQETFLDHHLFSNNRQKPGLIRTDFMNPRTLVQDSIMSIHSSSIGKSTEPSISTEIFRIELSEKYATRRALSKLGFSTNRMFSDIATAAIGFNDRLDTERVFGVLEEDEWEN